MFGYLARTFPVIARASLHRDGSLVSRLRRRVRLAEIDPNLHMNQAVYAAVTEYGRTDWAIRSRAWARWRAAGIKPVVAEQRIVYRRELRARARYVVDTRAVAVEGRLLCMQGLLIIGDRVHARSDVKLIFIGPRGVLSAAELAPHCERLLAPPLAVEDWRLVDA
ncbi:MAG: acyl-CoA thioesterase [Nannocystaceae bacterium]